MKPFLPGAARGPAAPAGLSPLLRCSATRPPAATDPTDVPQPRAWDPTWDESTPKITRGDHLGRELLDGVEQLGLSLLITAGFAAGLSLYTGMTLASPNLIRACEAMMFWTLALVSCMKSRRS